MNPVDLPMASKLTSTCLWRQGWRWGRWKWHISPESEPSNVVYTEKCIEKILLLPLCYLEEKDRLPYKIATGTLIRSIKIEFTASAFYATSHFCPEDLIFSIFWMMACLLPLHFQQKPIFSDNNAACEKYFDKRSVMNSFMSLKLKGKCKSLQGL